MKTLKLRKDKGSELTHDELDYNFEFSNPPGAIMAFANNIIPDGWLECNGAEISRTVYVNLFNFIDIIYGEGDGLTTFNIPDLRGEFIRGWDNDRGIDIDRIIGSYQDDLIKSHNHRIELYYGSWDRSPRYNHWFRSGSRGRGYGDRATTSNGGNETRPRNISMIYCIKY